MSKKMKPVNSPADIPRFDSEDEEHRFWADHELTDEFWDNAEPADESKLPPPRRQTITRPRKNPVSVRMENDLMKRLKALATVKGVGYQTLMRQFVADRVYEEEKREGILK